MTQRLVARVKRNNERYEENPLGGWFHAEILKDESHDVSGNNSRYFLEDLDFGIQLQDGTIVGLSNPLY